MRNKLFLSAAIALLLPLQSGARENSAALYRQGAQRAIEGDIDGAIEIFRKVIMVSPYYCLGHYGLGKAYLYKEGMSDKAILHLKKSVELDRKFVKGYFYLGMAYFLANNYREAARSFKYAYTYDDSYIEALYNLGAVYDIIDKRLASKIYFSKYTREKAKAEEDVLF